MKLDFSVLDAPVRAADKLEAEWCVPVAPRAPDRSFSTRAALTASDLVPRVGATAIFYARDGWGRVAELDWL